MFTFVRCNSIVFYKFILVHWRLTKSALPVNHFDKTITTSSLKCPACKLVYNAAIWHAVHVIYKDQRAFLHRNRVQQADHVVWRIARHGWLATCLLHSSVYCDALQRLAVLHGRHTHLGPARMRPRTIRQTVSDDSTHCWREARIITHVHANEWSFIYIIHSLRLDADLLENASV